MRKMMTTFRNKMDKMTIATLSRMKGLHKDEGGVDVIVMIVILAILIGFAIIFKDTIGTFLNQKLQEITAI